MALLAKLGTVALALFVVVSGFFVHPTPPPPLAVVSTTTQESETSSSTAFIATSSSAHTVSVPPVTRSTPSITSISPASGIVGDTITITGSGFTADSVVHFGPGAIQEVSVSNAGTKLTFKLPSAIGPYCKKGEACPMYAMLVTPNPYMVSVENTNGLSSTVKFTVLPSKDNPLL